MKEEEEGVGGDGTRGRRGERRRELRHGVLKVVEESESTNVCRRGSKIWKDVRNERIARGKCDYKGRIEYVCSC